MVSKMYRMNKDLALKKLTEKERAKLVNQLKNTVAPDDVVAAILSHLSKEEIPLNVHKIHSAVFKLKQKNPEMFEEFIFSTKDYYPYSYLLEQVLFRLQNADLINTLNLGFKKCIVSKESKAYIRKDVLPLFGNEDRKKLEKMGKTFEKAVLSTS